MCIRDRLSATPGTGQVTLNWTAVAGAEGYDLSVGSSPSGPFTLLTAVTELTYVDTGLTNGATYYFVVQAVTNGGASPNSNVVQSNTAPQPPSSLTAVSGNAQVTLTWPAVSGVTSYAVERSTVSGTSYALIGASGGPSYTDSNLINGDTYYYVVESTNANGTGGPSPQVSGTPSAALCVACLLYTSRCV